MQRRLCFSSLVLLVAVTAACGGRIVPTAASRGDAGADPAAAPFVDASASGEDTEPPAPAHPSVTCFELTCEGKTPVCCIDPSPHCVPGFVDCDWSGTGYAERIACEGVEDCAAGELCCYTFKPDYKPSRVCQKTAACRGAQACTTDEECVRKRKCGPYGACAID